MRPLDHARPLRGFRVDEGPICRGCTACRVAAGANALSRRELDEAAVRRCDRIVDDARDVAERECGDLHPLVDAGLLSWDALPELGEVLAGAAQGRWRRSDITLYESHGTGIQDLYTAKLVYEAAQSMTLGTQVG